MRVNSSIQDIRDAILAAGSIAVISHYNPDPDAYGSSCAMYIALKNIAKNVSCINETKHNGRYSFIPAVNDIVDIIKPCELVIVCDCGSIDRTGDNLKSQVAKIKTIINIDHHVSNDYFGHLNYVQPKASSTCEVLIPIIKALNSEITPQIATALFAGISADTGSFRYQTSSAETFRVAADLIEKGADLDLISREFWGNKSLPAVRLHAEAMRQMKMHFQNKLAEVVISPEMYNQTGSNSDDTEDLVERIRDIEGVQVSVLIKWDVSLWKISMRSKVAEYNLSDIAAKFGGGGHKAASAFRWKGSLDDLRNNLIPALQELFT